MKHLRNKTFQRFFCIILALVMFNLSIDPPDMLYNLDADPEMEEDLSINEIESISELVLEEGLDIENAVPETDDPDSENVVKKVEIFSPFEEKLLPGFNTCIKNLNTNFLYTQSHLGCIWSEIVNPPPEV